MRYQLPSGEIVGLGQQFTLNIGGDDITFPPNWLDLASQENLDDVGIVEVPDPAPAEPGLAELKQLKIAQIDAAAEAAIAPITAVYSQTERDTWPIQEAEAAAWTENPSAPTPMLDAIAAQRSMTRPDLVASVLEKAAAFKALAGATFGKRRVLVDQVNAATTPEAVGVIAW